MAGVLKKEKYKNVSKNMILVKFFERIAHLLINHEQPERNAHGRSF